MTPRKQALEALDRLKADSPKFPWQEDCFETIRAALSEPEWRPISTAPRDGTEVLVMYMHVDTQVVHNAFYASEEDGWEPEDFGWWSYERSEVSRIKLDGWMIPTHWRPLPPAPDDEETQPTKNGG